MVCEITVSKCRISSCGKNGSHDRHMTDDFFVSMRWQSQPAFGTCQVVPHKDSRDTEIDWDTSHTKPLSYEQATFCCKFHLQVARSVVSLKLNAKANFSPPSDLITAVSRYEQLFITVLATPCLSCAAYARNIRAPCACTDVPSLLMSGHGGEKIIIF